MRALRRRPALVCLALLALAMQAMLAFAQTHAHTHARRTADLESRALTFGACAATSELPCPVPVRDDDSQCEACSLIALAGSAVLEPPASLPLLAQPYAPLQPARTVGVLGRDAAAPFQARGPPRA
jgi:hypothetical protein